MYSPQELGQDLDDTEFRMFMFEQLQAIAQSFRETRPQVYTSSPTKPSNGLIVIADGTKWNPGSGAGYYGFYNGTWHFLG